MHFVLFFLVSNFTVIVATLPAEPIQCLIQVSDLLAQADGKRRWPNVIVTERNRLHKKRQKAQNTWCFWPFGQVSESSAFIKKPRTQSLVVIVVRNYSMSMDSPYNAYEKGDLSAARGLAAFLLYSFFRILLEYVLPKY